MRNGSFRDVLLTRLSANVAIDLQFQDWELEDSRATQ
jgi:hypothetical protein